MDEIGEKLDALLNDPKQFGKIAQLASSILGDGGDKSAPPSAPEPDLDLDMGQLRRVRSALRGGGRESGEGGRRAAVLQKFSLADLESEDLLLILVLYLMYRESGDKELLFILGGMLFL